MDEPYTDKEEKEKQKTGDEHSHGNVGNRDCIVKDMDMEEDESPNNDAILEWRTKTDTLEKENNVLKEQLEKLKHVVMNMNNQLKAKQC